MIGFLWVDNLIYALFAGSMSFKKSILSTLGLNIYSFMLGFFNSIMSTRILGAEGKGIFAIYTSSIELFALILGLGIPQALIFFAARDTIARNRLFYSSLLYVLAATLIFLVTVELSKAMGYQSFFLPAPFSSNTFKTTLVLNFSCLLGWHLLISILNGHKYFQQTNLISFISISITFIIYTTMFYMVYSNHTVYEADGFYKVQLAVAAFTLVATIYFHARLVGGWKGTALVSGNEGGKIVQYGLVYFLSNLLLFANNKMDYWFVNYFTGSAALGLYVLSSNVALLLFLLPNAFGLVLSAFKANSDLMDMERHTAFLCRITFLTTFLIALLLWLFSEPIILLLFGKGFIGSVMPLRILLLGVVPFTTFTILKNYFAGANHLSAFLKAALLGFVITLVMDILLIKPYGIAGAAIATTLSYLISASYLIYLFSIKTSKPWSDVVFFNAKDFHYTQQIIKSLFKP